MVDEGHALRAGDIPGCIAISRDFCPSLTCLSPEVLARCTLCWALHQMLAPTT